MSWRLSQFIRRLLPSQPPEAASPQRPEIVVAYLKLSSSDYGTEGELQDIHAFAAVLARALEDSGTGKYDGDEFGEGECGLFMFGLDADRMFDAVYPMLSAWPKMRGGYIIKRYGQPDKSETIRIE